MKILPVADTNPHISISRPYVTWAVVAVCVGVFIFQMTLVPAAMRDFIHSFAFVPGALTGELSAPAAGHPAPPWITIFTSMFLHAGIAHLIGNMAFLIVFGDNIEDAMGHGRFILFYLVCGLAASLAHVVASPASATPVVGASGAVSGILGAYIVLHPKASVRFLVFFVPIKLNAWVCLGLWFALQILMAASGQSGVAWWAHIGGFVVGAGLIFIVRRRAVPLFAGGTYRKGVQIMRDTPADQSKS
jgi:membrane associated rhomboid family serine protease